MPQLHKRLSQEQVCAILDQYLAGRIKGREAQLKLGLGKTRFFSLVGRYRAEQEKFSLTPPTHHQRHVIDPTAEKLILKELQTEKNLITDHRIPVNHYNYSAVRDLLLDKHRLKVSVPTIIKRAKDNGFYLPRPPRQIHDRIVATDFAGELVQHDSSHHLWSPYMTEKLYLITSLDDCTRLLLFADFFETETAWAHIEALRSVALTYGCPLRYYADQHSIFRYVKSRDTERPWHHYTQFTNDVTTQWKQVLNLCQTEVAYALSPQAKGKIERPYRWLQDRIVRIAAKEKLTTMTELKEVLRQLVEQYNNVWVHSTTKEIPQVRFENHLNNNLCLFRPLARVSPKADLDDVFCLRFQRKTDGYRRVSFDSVIFDLPVAEPHQVVEIHLIPQLASATVTCRFWQTDHLVGEKRIKLSELKTVRF